MTVPQHYCIMPFVSVRIEDDKNRNSMGFRPCCKFKANELKFTNIDEYLDSDFLKQIQHQFLHGNELPEGCVGCKQLELHGRPSTRTDKFKFYNSTPVFETTIKEIDVFPSNTCNLQCYMCRPKFSSSLGIEFKKLGWTAEIYNFDQTDQICQAIEKFKDLEQISISGGETFYLKHITRLLETLVSSSANRVKIFTNATVYKQEHVELLQKIPKLELFLSIDATEDIYEFVRYPANWQEVHNNLVLFRQNLPNAYLRITTVFGPINVFDIFNVINLADQLDVDFATSDISSDYYNWSILTDEEKSSVKDFIINGVKSNKLSNNQKINLMVFATYTLKVTEFNSDTRQTAVSNLASQCNIRNITPDTIKKVFRDLPNLGQEIISKL